MSRIGNKPITLAEGVSVEVSENNFVVVKGPKGELSRQFNSEMAICVEDRTVIVKRPDDSIEHKTIHGTTRAVLNSMVVGVTQGFSKGLEIIGTGYRSQLKGNDLVLNMGYSHQIIMPVPAGLKVTLASPTDITVSGIDKQAVGQFAAEIRAVRKPEPYKGKGIRYKGEYVRQKEGKKAK